MRNSHRPAAMALCIVFLAFWAPSATHAQEAGSNALKASASDARQAADTARAALEAAERAAAEAAANLEAAEQTAAAAETRAAEAPADSGFGAELQAVREEARLANEKAEAALAAIRELEERFAYDRDGYSLAAGAYWAPQSFDTSLDVDDSRGAYLSAGYRFASHFAAEVRGERLDDFRFSCPSFAGSIDGWGLTANAKVFFLTDRLQPYVSFGVGAMMWDLDYRTFSDGTQFRESGTDILFRMAGGLDIYVTPSIVLNLDAAYATSGGDVSGVKFGQLGGGVTFRF